MQFSVFGEEYAVFCTFKKSCAGWLVMQSILRSLDHYAGDLAAQGIVSDNIGTKKYVGVAAEMQLPF